MWQDFAITAIVFSFSFMMIPQIISSFKGKHMNPVTSGLQGLGIYALAYIVYTLNLKFSTISHIMNGLAWTVIFILERIDYGPSSKRNR